MAQLKDYEVAMVNPAGCPIANPVSVQAENATDAIEVAVSVYGVTPVQGCSYGVKLPGTNIALKFECGEIS